MVFDNAGFFDMGIFVMMGWWDYIAENHYVHLTKDKRPKEEIIALLKSCVKPIPRRDKKSNVIKKEPPPSL